MVDEGRQVGLGEDGLVSPLLSSPDVKEWGDLG